MKNSSVGSLMPVSSRARLRRPTFLIPAVAATGAFCTAFSLCASAQAMVLEEVTVTAQKRVQNLQDVPIAVSAMTGEKIADIAILDLEEVTQYMPNVTINAGAATPNLFIRGIGAGTNAGFEQSVGMYVDGVYAGRGPLAAVPSMMDLQQVEVLKGPQGILFGKNTVGGAVNITSARPSEEFEGKVEALYEPEHGEQQYNLVLSGPLAENLAGRIAVRQDRLEGWWDNVTNGEQGPDQENFYVRGSLLWSARDNIDVIAKYEYGDFRRSANPLVVYQSDIVGEENFVGSVPIPLISDVDKGFGDVSDENLIETDVFALTVNWSGSVADFTSITAYSAYDSSAVQNSDSVAVAALNRTLWEDFEQVSQEFRLVSPGGEVFDWIVGAYYQTSELETRRRNDELDFMLSGPLSVPALLLSEPSGVARFEQESESWALFGQGVWNVSDRVRLNLGLRYNEETKDLDKDARETGVQVRALGAVFRANPLNGQLLDDVRGHKFENLRREEEKLTFSATAQWDITDGIMGYVAMSSGFKGGGFDEAYSGSGETIRLADPITGVPTGEVVPGSDSSILEYEDESVISYEMGAKMRLLQGTAEINLAVFRMEYDDLQTSSLVGDVFRVGNAGEAVSQGVELDGRWLATEQLTIGGAVAYLDAYYEEFTGATCTVVQAFDPLNNPGCLRPDGSNIALPGESGGQDLGDETLLFAPDWSASINAQYVVPLSSGLALITALDANYTDEFYSALDLDPNTKHEDAVKFNARIVLASTDDTWSLALIGKNLTDEETHRWRNDVALTNSNSYFGIADRPRSIAILGRYQF